LAVPIIELEASRANSEVIRAAARAIDRGGVEVTMRTSESSARATPRIHEGFLRVSWEFETVEIVKVPGLAEEQEDS